MRKVSLLIVIIALLIGVFSVTVWLNTQRFQEISTQQLLNRYQQNNPLLIIDVREPYEYKAGHIPGAILIPVRELESHLDELDKEMEIFLVCRSGNRSRTAATLLAQNGFRRVYNVNGGMLSWEGPVEYSAP